MLGFYFVLKNEQNFRQLIDDFHSFMGIEFIFHETTTLHCSFETNVTKVFNNGMMSGEEKRHRIWPSGSIR